MGKLSKDLQNVVNIINQVINSTYPNYGYIFDSNKLVLKINGKIVVPSNVFTDSFIKSFNKASNKKEYIDVKLFR